MHTRLLSKYVFMYKNYICYVFNSIVVFLILKLVKNCQKVYFENKLGYKFINKYIQYLSKFPWTVKLFLCTQVQPFENTGID